MQDAVGSASKFFEQIFTKKTKLKDEFKMGFGISCQKGNYFLF